MYLSGLTHRDQLYEIATRWLADRVDAHDGRILTEIFAFERAITAPTVRRFVTDMCRIAGHRELYLERATTKDAVRQAIVSSAAHPSPRVAELIDWYRQLPEEFFPRTPVHISLITGRTGALAGLVRRKRMRRIADKVSRRVAAQLTDEIRNLARALAASAPKTRDANAGPPRAVFGAAERLVADRIRSGRLKLNPEGVRVDDVIGVKVLAKNDEQLARLDAALDELDYTWAFDREQHGGDYTGTHYAVDLELPDKAQIIESMQGTDWSFAAGRGLDEATLEGRFREYVESARRTFRVELILTTFDDLVESEFGSSIHEQRILNQRGQASRYGRIATNGAWIVEYMLRLAASPTVEIDELPIKLWGRYVRDTVAHAIARLHTDEPSEWLVPGANDEGLMVL